MNILKNTFLISISKILNLLTNLILGIIILRKYDLNFFGILAFTITLTNFFISLASWGFNQFTIREIASNGRKQFRENILNSTVQSKIIFSLIFMALYFFIYGIILKSQNINVKYNHHIFVFISSFIILFDSFKHYFNNSLYAVAQMQLETISIIMEKLFLFFTAIIGVYYERGLIYFILCLLFSKIISMIFSFVYFKKIIGFDISFKIEKEKFFDVIKKSYPFFLQAVMSYLYFQTDIILIGLFVSNEEVGAYQGSMSIVAALLVLPWAFMNTIFPKLSRRFKLKQFRRLKANLKQASFYSIAVTIPLAYIIFKYSEEIILFLYSENAYKSVYIFKVLIWLIIFRFQTYLIGYFLDAVKMEKDRALIVTYTAILNLILNLILIPQYQSIGAAISVFISDFILLIMCLFKLKLFFKKFSLEPVQNEN